MKFRFYWCLKLFLIVAAIFLTVNLLLAYEMTLSSFNRKVDCDCKTNFSFTTGKPFLETSRSAALGHKLCVVVPFRDRFDELQVFVPYMSKFLYNKSLTFEILIINQADHYRFNRANLINIGYKESLRVECDYFVMHDVDLLPLNVELDYNYPKEGPYHVASPVYHPRYHYKTFIGGILIMALEDYRLANGMSNKYWGWGLEDDEFYLRLKDARLVVRRPENLTTGQNDTFLHLHDKRKRKRDTYRVFNQKVEMRKRDYKTGLDTVRYVVISRSLLEIDNFRCTVVNVLLECDTEFTPWCELRKST